MAKMSEETQAIIDRLKAEGDLMRNSGTNSLKSVKVELGKFNNLFGVISKNIEAQTEALGLQAKISADQLEAQRTKEQFEELQQEKREKEKKQDNDDEDKTSEAIEKIGDALSSSFSLKNIAMAAGGIFVGYNLLKGFINEQTDGGFDRMINSISNIEWQEMTGTFNRAYQGIKEVDFSGLANTVNTMSQSMSNINWTNVSDAVNTMATRIQGFNQWLGETGVGDVVTAVAAGGLVTAGARGAAGGIFDALRGQGQTNLRTGLRAIPRGIAGVTAGLAIYYGDEIKGWLNSQMGNEEGGAGEQTVNTLVNTVTTAGTLLAVFGLGPVGIAAAAVAVGVGLGIMVRDWVRNRQATETERFNNQIDAAFAAAEAEEDQTNLSDETTQDLARALVEARRRTQLAIGEEARQAAADAQAQIEETLANQTVGDGTEGVSGAQLARLRQDVLDGKPGAVEELVAWARGRATETEGSFTRFRLFGPNQTNQEFFADIIGSLGDRMDGYNLNDPAAMDQFMADQASWEALTQQILSEHSYSRGSRGFKDFGRGTVSLLHGREAVVPMDSPEGAVLQALYNQSPADRVSGAAGGLGGNIVLNTPVTNVSAPMNMVNGGNQAAVTNVSMGGGGGGGPSLSPYGMTSGLVY